LSETNFVLLFAAFQRGNGMIKHPDLRYRALRAVLDFLEKADKRQLE
jgi:hypothetical protein